MTWRYSLLLLFVFLAGFYVGYLNGWRRANRHKWPR